MGINRANATYYYATIMATTGTSLLLRILRAFFKTGIQKQYFRSDHHPDTFLVLM